MRWRDVSFDRAEWRIPRTKNDTAQTVPLTPEAMQLLHDRRAQQQGGDGRESRAIEHVFEGAGDRGHLVEPKRGWDRVLARACALGFVEAIADKAGWAKGAKQQAVELALFRPDVALAQFAHEGRAQHVRADDYAIDDLRMHDLRRTIGSWQARTGASLAIIGKSLNHKSVQTTAIYARLDQDPVRESVQRATNAMFVAAGLRQYADEPVRLRSEKERRSSGG
jgi:integrase